MSRIHDKNIKPSPNNVISRGKEHKFVERSYDPMLRLSLRLLQNSRSKYLLLSELVPL